MLLNRLMLVPVVGACVSAYVIVRHGVDFVRQLVVLLPVDFTQRLTRATAAPADWNGTATSTSNALNATMYLPRVIARGRPAVPDMNATPLVACSSRPAEISP